MSSKAGIRCVLPFTGSAIWWKLRRESQAWQKVTATYCRVYGVIHFTSPAGWLPVHRDQLPAQHSVTSMGKFYLFYTRLTAFFPTVPGWAGIRKVKPIWILLKQETMSGIGISWAICMSFLAGCPSCRPTNSVKGRKLYCQYNYYYYTTTI